MEGDGGIEELVVAGDGRAHGVLVALPQAGRSLDVAEEERDDPGGQGTSKLGNSPRPLPLTCPHRTRALARRRRTETLPPVGGNGYPSHRLRESYKDVEAAIIRLL